MPRRIKRRTIEQYNLHLLDDTLLCGRFEIPTFYAADVQPKRLIGFHCVKSWKGDRKGIGVHFYLDDYQFERVWKRPEYWAERLAGFECVLTPDFSMYTDMPLMMQGWNHYRGMMIGQVFQSFGLRVVPSVGWAKKESWSFCFEGIPKHSTVAVSTVGIVQIPECRKIWNAGMEEMIRRVEPERILLYGHSVPCKLPELKILRYLPPNRGRQPKLSMNPRTIFLMKNRAMIFSIADRLGLSADEWEDFHQEVILRSMTTACHFHPSQSTISTYSHRFAQWVALKMKKESSHFVQIPENFEI